MSESSVLSDDSLLFLRIARTSCGEYISELVIGRRYENPNAEANNSWCYSELMYASGLTKTLYLVKTKNGVLRPTEITHEIADKFGVPISEIHRAQRTCSI